MTEHYPIYYLPPYYTIPCYYIGSYTVYYESQETVEKPAQFQERSLAGLASFVGEVAVEHVKQAEDHYVALAEQHIEKKMRRCFGFLY